MFDLMNPQLVQMEEERRRRDILDTIRSSRAAPARYRVGVWLRDVGERMAAEPTSRKRPDSSWAIRG